MIYQQRIRATLPLMVALAGLGIFFLDDWFGARQYIFESNIDNRDIILPMQLYFLEAIQQGHLPYLVPYIWSGARLMGDPNFQISPLHIVAALLLDGDRYLEFLSVWSVLVVCGSFWGAYRLIGVLVPDRSPWLAMAAGLLYVFSTGFFFARQFTNTEFVFLAIPWIWYWFYSNRPAFAVRNTAYIALILWFQFAYGQLQFSIYTAWLALLFCLFVPDKKYRRLNLRTLIIAAGCAAVLASYYLIPVIDNLATHGGDAGDRLFGSQSLTTKIVEPIYLLRLFFPSLFQWHYPELGISGDIATALGIARHETIPWWPIWKDGWSAWESFSAYQGSVVTIVVLFGIVFLKGSWFWRVGYVAIILATTTYAGALLLYVIHLGTDVPYGRITILLGVFATVLVVKTFFRILETRRMQIIFAIYLCTVAVATFVLSQVGLPERLVRYTFEQSSVPMDNFYAQYQASFQAAVLNHGIFIFGAAMIAVCYVVVTGILHSKNRIRLAKAVLVAGLVSVALVDAILFYGGAHESEWKRNSVTMRQAVFERHAVEAVLDKNGADFNHYRLHLDMPFEAHRMAAYAGTKSAEMPSRGLSQRWIPNRPILARIAITGGYSSVIPDGIRYTELLNWRSGTPDFRAHGEYSVLHPALFDVFAIRYVLRMKSEPKRNLDWRPAVLGPWERVFRENAKLLYEDDAYQLFKYERGSSIFYFPRRIIYTDSLVNDALGISSVVDHFIDRWEITGFLPRNLFPGGENKQYPNAIIEKQWAPGDVVAAKLDGAEWAVTLRAKDAGFLFAGLRYDPWWRVSVDDKSVSPIQANGVFTAVPITAGDHTVIFRLEPTSVWMGMAVTLIGFSSALLFLIVRQLRIRRIKHAFIAVHHEKRNDGA